MASKNNSVRDVFFELAFGFLNLKIFKQDNYKIAIGCKEKLFSFKLFYFNIAIYLLVSFKIMSNFYHSFDKCFAERIVFGHLIEYCGVDYFLRVLASLAMLIFWPIIYLFNFIVNVF